MPLASTNITGALDFRAHEQRWYRDIAVSIEVDFTYGTSEVNQKADNRETMSVALMLA